MTKVLIGISILAGLAISIVAIAVSDRSGGNQILTFAIFIAGPLTGFAGYIAALASQEGSLLLIDIADILLEQYRRSK